MSELRCREAFFRIHSGLSREGPGDSASLERALAIAGAAPDARVLDIACGPGEQTIDLARRLPRARVVAVDLHEPFLRDLGGRAADLGDRLHPCRADMARLPFAEAAFDLLWCEGAAYMVGVSTALTSWKRLLRPGGILAFTEPVWRVDQPSGEATTLFAAYPAMTSVEGVRREIVRQGWDLRGDFVLPPESWWDRYYRPMEERLRTLAPEFAGDPIAEAVVAEHVAEIDCFRRHGSEYGYAFFVAARPTPPSASSPLPGSRSRSWPA